MQASGNLGPAILDQLLKHFFEVTVLSRQTSTHIFPPSVKISRVDYGSKDSLVAALRGHDAIVSTLATLALERQLLQIDAAIAAGVRGFISSEFGSDTSDPKCTGLPVFHNKLATRKVLQDRAAAGSGMSYTVICTGPFLDWDLTRGFMNIKDKQISLYDGGDGIFSTTTLPTIGRAVCGVLAHSVETENRTVKVHDVATTQNKLFVMAKKARGPDGWTVENRSVEAMLGKSWADFKQGKHELPTKLGFIVAASCGQGFGGHFEKTQNELLDIPEMTDDQVQEVVNRLAE